MARGEGLSYSKVEDRDTANVPLHPSLHRGTRLHLLHGTERRKELERLLKISGIKMSVDKVLNMAKTVTTISVYMSKNKTHYIKTMPMKRHKPIEKLFEEESWGMQ